MFKKAEKSQQKLRLLLTGVSGSGKTYSSLLLAQGMGAKKIGLIDTENESASLYADKFSFDTLQIAPPYTTDKYIKAIKLAESDGYDVIIVDSVSHQWAGEGGLLNKKEQMDAASAKDKFANWAKITPEHEKFKNSILSCKSHIICTARSKQEYVVELNERGKSAPRKVGLAPVQRDGLEYEYTSVFDLSQNHFAIATKDRTSLFAHDLIFNPNEETGKLLIDWLNSGKPATQPVPLLGSGVFCFVPDCGKEIVLHPSGKGYLCPSFTLNNPVIHTKIKSEEIEAYREKIEEPLKVCFPTGDPVPPISDAFDANLV